MAGISKNVSIATDEQGNVIRISKNNPEFAHIRIIQNKVMFNAQGWVNNKQLSALLHGKVDDLKSLNLNAESTLPGNIIIREQMEAFNTNDPERDYKIAGETGIVCCRHGEPIYRKTFYDASGTQEDELIPHTNTEDIKNALGSGNMTQSQLDEVLEKGSKKKAKKEVEEEVIDEDTDETGMEEPVEVEEGETFEL